MPTYEYSCTGCGHTFERFESMTAKPNNACPKCKKRKGQRNISGGGGLIFKGSGFYTTDYRSSNYKQAAKSDTSSGSSAKGACGTCGDPKGPGACKTPKATKSTD